MSKLFQRSFKCTIKKNPEIFFYIYIRKFYKSTSISTSSSFCCIALLALGLTNFWGTSFCVESGPADAAFSLSLVCRHFIRRF